MPLPPSIGILASPSMPNFLIDYFDVDLGLPCMTHVRTRGQTSFAIVRPALQSRGRRESLSRHSEALARRLKIQFAEICSGWYQSNRLSRAMILADARISQTPMCNQVDSNWTNACLQSGPLVLNEGLSSRAPSQAPVDKHCAMFSFAPSTSFLADPSVARRPLLCETTWPVRSRRDSGRA
jgi:hypothetical protein